MRRCAHDSMWAPQMRSAGQCRACRGAPRRGLLLLGARLGARAPEGRLDRRFEDSGSLFPLALGIGHVARLDLMRSAASGGSALGALVDRGPRARRPSTIVGGVPSSWSALQAVGGGRGVPQRSNGSARLVTRLPERTLAASDGPEWLSAGVVVGRQGSAGWCASAPDWIHHRPAMCPTRGPARSQRLNARARTGKQNSPPDVFCRTPTASPPRPCFVVLLLILAHELVSGVVGRIRPATPWLRGAPSSLRITLPRMTTTRSLLGSMINV